MEQAFSLLSAYAGLRLPTCAFCYIPAFKTLIFLTQLKLLTAFKGVKNFIAK